MSKNSFRWLPAFALLAATGIVALLWAINSGTPRQEFPAPVQYIIPFRDGDCYKIDRGILVFQVEVGRKDGMILVWKSPEGLSFFPVSPGELPQISGKLVYCPADTVRWPEHPPVN